jgi:HPt (histidine-containing phosphotransfer) domain-containing protein
MPNISSQTTTVLQNETETVAVPSILQTPDILPQPPIDFGRLQLVADTPEKQASVMALFFRIANEIITTMEKARDNEETRQWKEAAHSLRGASANLGMAALESFCRQSEEPPDLTDSQRNGLLENIYKEIEHIKIYLMARNPVLLERKA